MITQELWLLKTLFRERLIFILESPSVWIDDFYVETFALASGFFFPFDI